MYADRLSQILRNIEHSIKFSGNNELAGVIDEKGFSGHLFRWIHHYHENH
jgi:hypothetical protein